MHWLIHLQYKMTYLNRTLKLNFSAQAGTNRVLMILVSGWLFLSLIQTLHFYWYFEQSLWNSVRWSFRDWFVWFVIFGCLFYLFINKARLTSFSTKNILCIAVIAIFCGFLQTFIVVSLDYIAGNPTRPFWEDFWRFYSKRWLQHLFVFSIFWLLMLNRFAVRQNDPLAIDQNDRKAKVQKVQINDGKNTQWIEQSDIFCVEAAGNYMCFHTSQGQLISRGSLKQMDKMLDRANFVRVSRSNIVNINKIMASHRVNRSRVELTLSNDHKVTIGPTYWRAIKNRLDI